MQNSEKVSNQVYYDAIAPAYNDQFKIYPANETVRLKVANYFCSKIPPGKVLDFGGGTGLDLQWLLEKGYNVVFCEPSEKMRLIAKKQADLLQKENVYFLGEVEAKIGNWRQGFSLSNSVDACLANFAVLNCIRNLDELFEKLALVIKSNGSFIVTILDTRFRFLISSYLKSYLKSFISREIVTYSYFDGVQQEIYLHTLRKIETSAQRYFKVANIFPLGGFGFLLIHLTKK